MKNVVLEFNSNGNDKQKECGRAWANDDIDEVLYGGAKGGGKSFIGCSLILADAMMYAGTQYFIARKQLNDLRRFTIPSIHEVLNGWGIPQEAWKYNGQDNYFELYNGSRVLLLDCKYLPSDPQYQRLGSMQFTRGWIEEGGEFDYDSYSNLKISIGRWKNREYNLKGKLLITANPSKNFLYKEFYTPYKEGTLNKRRAFIQALPYDNKMLPREYIQNLENTLRGAEKQRLLNGLWEYDDDPNALCDYDKILAVFGNDQIAQDSTMYLTADIARFGSDLCVIGVWRGWELIEIYTLATSATTEIQSLINTLRMKYNIPKGNCIADEDGVGGGVVDNTAIVGFKNNSTPIEENGQPTNYKNLQTQCLYKLAERININNIYISAEVSERTKEMITEELEQIKSDNKEGQKLSVINKDAVKQAIGRSPDYRDMLLMREYFDLKPRKTFKPIFRR